MNIFLSQSTTVFHSKLLDRNFLLEVRLDKRDSKLNPLNKKIEKYIQSQMYVDCTQIKSASKSNLQDKQFGNRLRKIVQLFGSLLKKNLFQVRFPTQIVQDSVSSIKMIIFNLLCLKMKYQNVLKNKKLRKKIRPITKYPSSLNIWAAATLQENITSDICRHYQEETEPFVKSKFKSIKQVKQFSYNDPKHVSQKSLKQIQCAGIQRVDWPSYSWIQIPLRIYGLLLHKDYQKLKLQMKQDQK